MIGDSPRKPRLLSDSIMLLVENSMVAGKTAKPLPNEGYSGKNGLGRRNANVEC